MKKLVSILLAIVLVLSLAACGNAENSSAPQSSSQNTSSEAELTPLQQGKKYVEKEDWIAAIETLKTIISIEDDYQEAQTLLKTATEKYTAMVITEVDRRVASNEDPVALINYIVQSQKVTSIPELIDILDAQYKVYTDSLTEEAGKLYDEGRITEATKIFDDAFAATNFAQVNDAKDAFFKSKAVYLMKDIQPFQQHPSITTSTEVNDARGYTPEVIAFGLQEKGTAVLQFNLNGEYSRLRGTVFIPQYCDDVYSAASVKIKIDGAELFSRTKLKQGFVAAEFDLSVVNRRKVTIEIIGGSNGEKTNYPWIGDAYVIK